MRCWTPITCLLTALAASVAPAAEVDFEQVAAILVRHCAGCHNASDPAGGLDVSTRAALLKGGDSGAALAPGDPKTSYLLERIREGEMPPAGKGKPLDEAETARLMAWIKEGAKWPAGRTISHFEFTTATRAGRDWWSLQRPRRPAVPTPSNAAWPRNPIDAFVAQGLAEHNLSPSPEADRASYLRRVKLDLVGLPPTPQEVAAFVEDKSPDAYEKLVDRLLASPHYGERWARHWLDIVRFGESDGYETNKQRLNAWLFRDYVIRTLNEDVPYPQFILEQLAGDQVGADEATGFLVGGAHDVVGNKTEEGKAQQRLDDLHDIVSTVGQAFLGLSVGCAKCHDHKFDPIAQRDYYALSAVFAGVEHGERPVRQPGYEERKRREADTRRQIVEVERELAPLIARYDEQEMPARTAPPMKPLRREVDPLRNVERFEAVEARYVRFTVQATAGDNEPCLDELEVFSPSAPTRNLALSDCRATASSVYRNGSSKIHQTAHVNDGKFGNGWSWISNERGQNWVQLEFARTEKIDRIVWSRDREGRYRDRLPTKYTIEVATKPDEWRVVATSNDRRAFDPKAGAAPPSFSPDRLPKAEAEKYAKLVERRKKLSEQLPETATRLAYAGTFTKDPQPIRRLHRGEVLQQREPIGPAAIGTLGGDLKLAKDAPEHTRRMALARWIGSADNPLTARVLVNRLWHYHFGQGLASSPSDFGFNGGRPSHPELLDWLAHAFIDGGWKMKPIHRLIVLSQTYRQASGANLSAEAIDAEARWLWRFPSRRLEAEAIRDSMLFVSGTLDTRMGGPGYDIFEANTNYVRVYTPKRQFGPPEWRRMVYQLKPRMRQDATFGAFDCPDASQMAPKRPQSTTALQALNLLNSPFVVQQSEKFAERLERETPRGADQRSQALVETAFRLAFSRSPDREESRRSQALIREHGLPAFCRALLNTNEFIYLY